MSDQYEPRVLTPDQARRFYNRIGRIQDWQRFYEAGPISNMLAHADLARARSVYELGCGTGALARRLLADELSDTATYFGVDISEKMLAIASKRVALWRGRATLGLVAGDVPLPGADNRYDRFVATYVFDLLDEAATNAVLSEAQRLLEPSGLICIVSLAAGVTRPSKAFSAAWSRIWRRWPQLVGGCRPVEMSASLVAAGWDVMHRTTISPWAIPSEVVIAANPT